MTTRVIIQSPRHNHKCVRVGVLSRTKRPGPTGDAGAASTSEVSHVILDEGQSIGLYVHDGQVLYIEEAEREAYQADEPEPILTEPISEEISPLAVVLVDDQIVE